MKTMLLSDLVIARRALIQLFGMIVGLVVCICVFTKTLFTVAACFATMVPLLYLFTISAYDESNNWQTYRLSLPLSREAVVQGRYAGFMLIALASAALGVAIPYLVCLVAGTLEANLPFLASFAFESNPPIAICASSILGAAMAVFIGSITLPFAAKMGMTKSVRFVPIAFVLIFFLIPIMFGDGGPLAAYVPDFLRYLATDDNAVPLLISLSLLASLAALFISMAISTAIYRKREL